MARKKKRGGFKRLKKRFSSKKMRRVLKRVGRVGGGLLKGVKKVTPFLAMTGIPGVSHAAMLINKGGAIASKLKGIKHVQKIAKFAGLAKSKAKPHKITRSKLLSRRVKKASNQQAMHNQAIRESVTPRALKASNPHLSPSPKAEVQTAKIIKVQRSK